jgi:hypothetical protein
MSNADLSEDQNRHAKLLGSDDNVLGKRAGQASEPVKILHTLHSTTHYTSNIEDIETKQIALSSTYPNSMFARATLATSEWYSSRSTSWWPSPQNWVNVFIIIL